MSRSAARLSDRAVSRATDLGDRCVRTAVGTCLVLAAAACDRAAAATLPAGFQESVVASGLAEPTAAAFSPDGRIFVAEKSGRIKVFDGPGDPTPTIFADLRTNVHNFWDRGMASLALHPNFPQTPYVYVTYTLDAPIGGTPPVWGTAGARSDGCPTPPGPTTDGCVVAGRLSRLQASGNTMVGPEQVLIEAWCQQFPSHSVDGIVFGGDGALYVSAGEGASFNAADYGQFGNPLNPCGDPPAGLGGAQTAPGAEGGALRAQSVRRAPGEPAVLNGTVLRVDPITGQALPDNPLVGSGIPGAERIIAYGLRNPFRLTARPGTREIWVGDVGWNAWDEIDRIADTSDAVIENFGWPCYEGLGPQPSFRAVHLDQCRRLYEQAGTVTAPEFTYTRGQAIVAGEPCGTGGNTVSGLAFYQGGSYPSVYNGALFFADYSRNCIWAMLPGADGAPDPNQRANFVIDGNAPVDLKIGPGGDLYYVAFYSGTVRRIQFVGASQPPIAVAHSDVSNGALPLTVHFDGSHSSDPDPGDSITYAWDLDGDGEVDDSTAVAPQYTYTQAGTVPVRLQVTDSHGLSATATLLITAGNTAPTATMTAPLPTMLWQVGSLITFSGSATDREDGSLSGGRLSWEIIMHHCPQNNCHLHPVQTYSGVSGGSFSAPDHEYLSFLEVRLTATDSGGLADTKSVYVLPRAVTLTLQTIPVRPCARHRQRKSGHAVPAHRDRGFSQHDQRAVAAVAQRRHLPLHRLVGRRQREPHRHRRRCPDDVHRHVDPSHRRLLRRRRGRSRRGMRRWRNRRRRLLQRDLPKRDRPRLRRVELSPGGRDALLPRRPPGGRRQHRPAGQQPAQRNQRRRRPIRLRRRHRRELANRSAQGGRPARCRERARRRIRPASRGGPALARPAAAPGGRRRR